MVVFEVFKMEKLCGKCCPRSLLAANMRRPQERYTVGRFGDVAEVRLCAVLGDQECLESEL